MAKHKKFTKDQLLYLADKYSSEGDYPELVLVDGPNLVDKSRWADIYEFVFEDTRDNKFYQSSYRVGATEMQEERPYEYDDDEISCDEVRPVEVLVVKYEVVKE